MHGGISQKITNLDSLRKTKKPENIPDDGLLCDLMWADPEQNQKKNKRKRRRRNRSLSNNAASHTELKKIKK